MTEKNSKQVSVSEYNDELSHMVTNVFVMEES